MFVADKDLRGDTGREVEFADAAVVGCCEDAGGGDGIESEGRDGAGVNFEMADIGELFAIFAFLMGLCVKDAEVSNLRGVSGE